MNQITLLKATLVLGITALTTACAADYQPLTVEVNNDRFIARGVIDESTPDLLRETMADHANVKTLVLQNVPGSVDDEANLEIAKEVRKAGLTTIVPANGVVASGGTDLFLAGQTRIIEPGACLGVHTWGEYRDGEIFSGAQVPKDDPVHQLYLSYYQEMQIPVEFYWFTLTAAPVEDVHFVDVAEINKFLMASTTLTELDADSELQRYKRCINRLDAGE